MGKKDQPTPPELPDVQEMIAAQARANRVSSTSPYGGQTFTEDPQGRWTSETQFSPELQALFERQTQMAGAAPTRYSSSGMGSELQARIAKKLGRSTPSESIAPEYGKVEMPVQEEPPQVAMDNPRRPMETQDPNIQRLIRAMQTGDNRGKEFIRNRGGY